jgi:hypothetical protein
MALDPFSVPLLHLQILSVAMGRLKYSIASDSVFIWLQQQTAILELTVAEFSAGCSNHVVTFLSVLCEVWDLFVVKYVLSVIS